jgi:hypothetical protein
MSGDMKASNVVEIFLPVVVILQEVEKRSGVKREARSANAPFSRWGIVYSAALDLPIITGGSRGNHKTENAEDVEPAKCRVLSPLDMLELWDLVGVLTKPFAGRDGWSLDLHHGGCSFCVELLDGDN